jgi:hypothetical protein
MDSSSLTDSFSKNSGLPPPVPFAPTPNNAFQELALCENLMLLSFFAFLSFFCLARIIGVSEAAYKVRGRYIRREAVRPRDAAAPSPRP